MPGLTQAMIAIDAELLAAEPVLEDLDQPEAALENLVDQTGIDPSCLRTADGWASMAVVDGTALFVLARGGRWSILAAPSCDPADAMSAARKLHGLLGEKPEGWDLDR
jgi:hypothetical protein